MNSHKTSDGRILNKRKGEYFTKTRAWTCENILWPKLK